MERPDLAARNRAVRGGRTPYENREWLRSRYEDEGLSLREIAAEADCGLRTIARWMQTHDIASRRVGHKRPTVVPRAGVDHPRWSGKTLCPDCGGQKRHTSARCRQCANRAKAGVGVADVMVLVRIWCAKRWRPRVLKRDGYRCTHCGTDVGDSGHAHHDVPLAVLIAAKEAEWSPPDLDTAAGRYQFARRLTKDPAITDLDNGRTLCGECHRQAHHGWKPKAWKARS